MSAFAVIAHRDGSPVETEVLDSMIASLSARGLDGCDQLAQGWIGLAHQHFWSTPEESGERQPLADAQAGLMLVFDGRLDNREELLATLHVGEANREEGPSDAELVLAAYRRWAEEVCRYLIGPFALVIGDLGRHQVLCARDPLGDRTLFYRLTDQKLLVASEESALLEHPEVGSDLDGTRLACFFAHRMPADGSTFFRQVRELLPGEQLLVGTSTVQRSVLWHPTAEPSMLRRTESDAAEEFRELLQQAVRCRLRAAAPPAVMMSGGLDSTSVAALGAEELRRDHPESRLRIVSWVFDELASCDERSYMDPVIDRWALEALRVRGDDAIPLAHEQALCLLASTPEDNVYRELKRRAYSLAAEAGSRVVLNCASADALYTGGDRWLGAMVHAGQPAQALRELLAEVGRWGLRDAVRRSGALRWAVRAKRAFLLQQSQELPWLTPAARRSVAEASGARFDRFARLRPHQLEAVAGLRAARGVSLENAYAGRQGIEVRDPYRDRRLVEFMLRLPAHHLYREGRYKHVARQALNGWLPDSILGRTEPTLLTPLFDQGLRQQYRQAVEELLGSKDALWPEYVEKEWVEGSLRASISPAVDVVLWNCVSLELWLRRHGWSSIAPPEGLS